METLFLFGLVWLCLSVVLIYFFYYVLPYILPTFICLAFLKWIFLKETFGHSVYLVCSMWQSFDVVQRWYYYYYYHDWLNDLQCDSAEERTTAIWLLTVCAHNSDIVFWNLYFRSEYIFVLSTIVLFARWLHYRLCLTSDF